MSKKILPQGERIALAETEQEYKGRIVLPERHSREMAYGKCIAVGDGKIFDGTTKDMYAKLGETYMFQIDGNTRVNSTVSVENKPVLILHQADMIFRMNESDVTVDSIDMMSHWVLVEPYMDTQSNIVIPDSVKDYQFDLQHFTLVKKGPLAVIQANIGDEILLARTRATPLGLDGKTYAFLTDQHIYGSIPA